MIAVKQTNMTESWRHGIVTQEVLSINLGQVVGYDRCCFNTSSAAFFFDFFFILIGLLTKLHSSISSLICPGHMLQSVASLCKHPYQLLHRDGRPVTKAQMWQCHPV